MSQRGAYHGWRQKWCILCLQNMVLTQRNGTQPSTAPDVECVARYVLYQTSVSLMVIPNGGNNVFHALHAIILVHITPLNTATSLPRKDNIARWLRSRLNKFSQLNIKASSTTYSKSLMRLNCESEFLLWTQESYNIFRTEFLSFKQESRSVDLAGKW